MIVRAKKRARTDGNQYAQCSQQATNDGMDIIAHFLKNARGEI